MLTFVGDKSHNEAWALFIRFGVLGSPVNPQSPNQANQHHALFMCRSLKSLVLTEDAETP